MNQVGAKALLVENSRFFTKVVRQFLREVYGVEVEAVRTMAEAGTVLQERRGEFWVALTSLELEDSSKGEVVDSLLLFGMPTIVFSGSPDKQLRDKILSKNIVDYVVKESVASLLSLRAALDGLLHNRNYSVVIVNPDPAEAARIAMILEAQDFTVWQVPYADNALRAIASDETIQIVVVSDMVEGGGAAFVSRLRRLTEGRQMEILGIVTDQSEDTVRLLKNGASDFIRAPFSPEEFRVRMANAVRTIDLQSQVEAQAQEKSTILETAVDGIITISESGTIELVNQAASGIFGYEEAELIGQNVTILMPAERRAAHDGSLQAYFQQTDRSGEVPAREVTALRKNGEVFPLELSVGESMIHGKRKLTGVMRDITNRKLLENQLQESLRSIVSAYDTIHEDLKAAEQLQLSRLPASGVTLGKTLFEHSYVPSAYLSGDFLNYFPLDEGVNCFFCVDVSGHGVPAALMSVSLSNIVNYDYIRELYLAEQEKDQPDLGALALGLVNRLNQRFQLNSENTQYFTILMGVVDEAQDRLHLVQAGQPSPVLMMGETVEMLNIAGLPVGFLDEPGYEVVSLDFKPGQRLILYTDGVTEASGATEEQFGDDRFCAYLKEKQGRPLAELVGSVVDYVKDWSDKQTLDDDITVMGVERML